MNSADPSFRPSAPVPSDSSRPLGSTLWVPWTLVATLTLLCFWLAQLWFMTRAENAVLRDQQRLTELELRNAQQHAEAERILAQREIADLRRQLPPR